MKYGGYTGKFLTVDLSARSFGEMPVTDELAEHYLGGRGFVAKLLYDLLPRGIDPLGPENVIVFATGPATGTMIPTASRIAVGVKSPQTGTISASYMGGHFGPELKYAGWDGIVITGVSESPVTLVVDDDRIELRDATRALGQGHRRSPGSPVARSRRGLQDGRHRARRRERRRVRHVHARAARRRPRRPGSRVRQQEAQGRGGPRHRRRTRQRPDRRLHRGLQGAARHHHGEPGAPRLPVGGHDRHAARRERSGRPALQEPPGRPRPGRRPHPQRGAREVRAALRGLQRAAT